MLILQATYAELNKLGCKEIITRGGRKLLQLDMNERS